MRKSLSGVKIRKVIRVSQVRDAGSLAMRVERGQDGALTFTLPVPPSANRWWRSVKLKTKRGVRYVVLLSKEARDYKSAVRAAYQSAEISGEIAVSLTWYRERRSGDLDKRIGVCLDALQGVAYATDAQITELSAKRVEDPKNPRVIVTVRAA